MAKETPPPSSLKIYQFIPFSPFFYKKQKTERYFFLTLKVVYKCFGLHFFSF